MIKVLSMERMGRPGANRFGVVANGRRAGSEMMNKSAMRLVMPGDFQQERSRETESYPRLFKDHPGLIDSAFIGLALGAAALACLSGW